MGRVWGCPDLGGVQRLFEGASLLSGLHLLGAHPLFLPSNPKCALPAPGRLAAQAVMSSAFPAHHPGPRLDPRLPFFEAVSLLKLCCPFQPLRLGQCCADVHTGPPWCPISGSSWGAFVPLLSLGSNYFCKSIHLFCSRQLCVCQGSIAMIAS